LERSIISNANNLMKERYVWIVIALYTLIQLIYVAFFPLPFISDSSNYLQFAKQAVDENTYYPNPSSIYSKWLVAPVYINYVVGLLRISSNSSIILYFNILLNLLQLFLVYRLTEKLYNSTAAWISVLGYIFYLNNLGLVLMNHTEFMFGIFILGSINFYFSSPLIRNYLLCGLFAGLAIGIRPTGFALLFAYGALYLYDLIFKKYEHKKIGLIMMGVVTYVLIMGCLSLQNINKFEYTSTTGPANLIMSAYPKSTGVYDSRFTETDSLYKTKKTYFERNEYLMNKSIQYIKEDPLRWISLIPRKIYSTFIFDGWTINKLINREKWDLNYLIKGDRKIKESFKAEPIQVQLGFWVLNFWQYIIYGLIMTLFFYKLIFFKKWVHNKSEILFILFIVIGVSLSILSSVGNARYKYNFVIAAIILISPLLHKVALALVDRLWSKEMISKSPIS